MTTRRGPRRPAASTPLTRGLTTPVTALATALVTVLVSALLAGCTGGSSEPDPQPTLLLPSGSSPYSCQAHQEQPPGPDYAGGAQADTARVLTLLRYWKENGEKPFCDGEPATEADTAWADLVRRLLDNEPAPTTSPAPATTT